ncbi:EamA family transporter [Microbacterium sp. BK668]|uniref:EamA family transporter n=1 Tax=Microbacterium sp. BK668 TaxID=2512118 RepID=UPI00105CA44B|nr:EamA family transporter [Microbacterium sp. BK668]TDN92123.1 EamA-like transporter family protein [Microbacterium sp. BK668]
MIPALVALAGALVYGSADFLGGLAARGLRSIVVTAVAAVAGLLLVLGAYPFVGGAWIPADVAWGVLSGFTGAAAVVLLYACLAIGPMSILSPLTAVVSAIAPILWGLVVDGETLSAVGFAGLGIALVAVVLVGFIPGAKVVRPSLRGLLLAIGAGSAIGAFLIVIDQTSDDSGLVPLLLNRSVSSVVTITAVVVLAVLAARSGRGAASVLPAAGAQLGATPTGHADLEHAADVPARTRTSAGLRGAFLLAAACGVVDAAANLLMLFALRAGDLTIVSALTAMYPAGTILLAAIVLRERIAAVQWAGLALALTAGALLALA